MLEKYFVFSILPLLYVLEKFLSKYVSSAKIRPLSVFVFFLLVVLNVFPYVLNVNLLIMIQLVTVGSLLILKDLRLQKDFIVTVYSIWVFILSVTNTISLIEVYAFVIPLLMTAPNIDCKYRSLIAWLTILLSLVSVGSEHSRIDAVTFIDFVYVFYIFCIFKYFKVNNIQNFLIHLAFIVQLKGEFGFFTFKVAGLILVLALLEIYSQISKVKKNRFNFYILIYFLLFSTQSLSSTISIIVFSVIILSELFKSVSDSNYTSKILLLKYLPLMCGLYYFYDQGDVVVTSSLVLVLLYEGVHTRVNLNSVLKKTNIPAS